jgi:DNA-binding GntR family transcriptional regulator
MSGGWEPVAPWRALYALLRARIEDGTYPPRTRLPSIVQLSQEHGLSSKTVRKALDKLKDDGLIVTSPMGTFVASH